MKSNDLPLCQWCDEVVLSPSGIIANGNFHSECAIRTVVGGVNHLQRLCSCYGGGLPQDPPQMTKREAALAAVAYYQVHCRRLSE